MKFQATVRDIFSVQEERVDCCQKSMVSSGGGDWRSPLQVTTTPWQNWIFQHFLRFWNPDFAATAIWDFDFYAERNITCLHYENNTHTHIHIFISIYIYIFIYTWLEYMNMCLESDNSYSMSLAGLLSSFCCKPGAVCKGSLLTQVTSQSCYGNKTLHDSSLETWQIVTIFWFHVFTYCDVLCKLAHTLQLNVVPHGLFS